MRLFMLADPVSFDWGSILVLESLVAVSCPGHRWLSLLLVIWKLCSKQPWGT